MDDNDAYERRDTIIIAGQGIPEVSQGEICSNVVRNLIQEKLNIVIQNNDISTAHRLGPKRENQSSDKRNLIVKLCRRDLKRDLISASKRQQSPSIFINESLTPTRKTILNALRKMKRDHPNLVKGCSTFNGRVFAFTPVTQGPSTRDVRHLVNNHETLVKFCCDYVKLPLDLFLQSFSQ